MADPGFILFGRQHVLTLLAILALAALLPLSINRARSRRLVRAAALGMGVGILLFKAGETAWYAFRGVEWFWLLPLHLCDAAALAAGSMLLTRNQRLYELAYFWGMGGSLQALLTPDLQEGFPSLGYWLFFTSHGLVIAGAVYATALLALRPVPKSILRVFIATAALAAVAIPINFLYGTNYLYLARKPGAASLMDFLGPWPWYILSLAPVTLLFLFLWYSPFWIADRRPWSRGRKKASYPFLGP